MTRTGLTRGSQCGRKVRWTQMHALSLDVACQRNDLATKEHKKWATGRETNSNKPLDHLIVQHLTSSSTSSFGRTVVSRLGAVAASPGPLSAARCMTVVLSHGERVRRRRHAPSRLTVIHILSALEPVSPTVRCIGGSEI